MLYEDVQQAAERNGETATDAVVWGLQQYLERDGWRARALAAERRFEAAMADGDRIAMDLIRATDRALAAEAELARLKEAQGER